MTCAMPQYSNLEAHRMRDNLRTATTLQYTIRHCAKCRTYHVIADIQKYTAVSYGKQLITWIAQGLDTVDIANIRGRSYRTIQHQIQRIMDDLNATNKTNLVAIALAVGIIEPSDIVVHFGDHKRS